MKRAAGLDRRGKTIAEPEPEFIGIMCEALFAESYKQVMPAYFDVCLKQRYAQSPEDAEMMDLCVNARVFDLGYVYDNWKGVSFYFQDLLVDVNHPDITSFYKKREKAANKYYEKAVKLFEEGNRAGTRFPEGAVAKRPRSQIRMVTKGETQQNPKETVKKRIHKRGWSKIHPFLCSYWRSVPAQKGSGSVRLE